MEYKVRFSITKTSTLTISYTLVGSPKETARVCCYPNRVALCGVLTEAGLPLEIADSNDSDRIYTVTAQQLRDLGFLVKDPTW